MITGRGLIVVRMGHYEDQEQPGRLVAILRMVVATWSSPAERDLACLPY